MVCEGHDTELDGEAVVEVCLLPEEGSREVHEESRVAEFAEHRVSFTGVVSADRHHSGGHTFDEFIDELRTDLVGN